MRKPILCLDFDGVIHSYKSGWQGARNIPDPPVEGALNFMLDALEEGYDVVVHSSRSRYIGGIWAMSRWLERHAGNLWDTMGPSLCQVRFVRFKPPALLTLDDRALTFTGKFPALGEIKAFRPWTFGARKP